MDNEILREAILPPEKITEILQQLCQYKTELIVKGITNDGSTLAVPAEIVNVNDFSHKLALRPRKIHTTFNFKPNISLDITHVEKSLNFKVFTDSLARPYLVFTGMPYRFSFKNTRRTKRQNVLAQAIPLEFIHFDSFDTNKNNIFTHGTLQTISDHGMSLRSEDLRIEDYSVGETLLISSLSDKFMSTKINGTITSICIFKDSIESIYEIGIVFGKAIQPSRLLQMTLISG